MTDQKNNYKLRYYAPDYDRATHETVLDLLEQIRTVHGVVYDVVEIRHTIDTGSGNTILDSAEQKTIYERDFLPRKGVLKARTGQPLGRLLRSRSGNHYVVGTVAITSGDLVEWCSHFGGAFAAPGVAPSVAFLGALLRQGPSLLAELCPPVRKASTEDHLIETFLKSDTIVGAVSQEVRIGGRRFSVEGATFDWRKSIDLLIEQEGWVWIIEAKVQLNYEAFGEVLTYASLYRRQYPIRQVRMGIVCGEINEEIMAACHEYGITIFEVRDSEVREHRPAAGKVKDEAGQHSLSASAE